MGKGKIVRRNEEGSRTEREEDRYVTAKTETRVGYRGRKWKQANWWGEKMKKEAECRKENVEEGNLTQLRKRDEYRVSGRRRDAGEKTEKEVEWRLGDGKMIMKLRT